MTHSSSTQTRPASFVNRREIRVIGMSRSGNHALINWIRAQADGRVCFLNCTEGKTNPFESARPLGEAPDSGYEANYDGFDLAAERAGEFSRKDWLVFSHEDSFLGHACSDIFERHHDEWVGSSEQRYDVLLLRDPYNLMASRRRVGFAENSEKLSLRIWRQHARQFLGETKRLQGKPVPVSYNRWCVDADYRRQIAGQLDLDFSDAGKKKVASCAGGSSFDGLAYDGEADRMPVFERFHHYLDDPSFAELFDDKTHRYAEEIFGWLPGLDRLRGEPEPEREGAAAE